MVCGNHLTSGLDGKRVTTTTVGLLHFTGKQFVFCGWVPVVLSWRQMMKLNTVLFKVTCSNNDHTPLWVQVCEIPSADNMKLNKGENEGFNSVHRQWAKVLLSADDFNSLMSPWLFLIWQSDQEKPLNMNLTSIYFQTIWFDLMVL